MSTSSGKKGEDDSAQKCPVASKSKVADDSSSSLSAPSTTGDANAKSTDMMKTTDQSSSSLSSSAAAAVVVATAEKTAGLSANTSKTMATNDTKIIDNNAALNDPTKFWAAWSARKQHDCLDGDDSSKKGCNCFEGLGSVM